MLNKGKLTRTEIERNIRAHEVRLGIETAGITAVKPQPTVTIYPSPYVTERLALFGADRLIANDAAYDAACRANDSTLAGMLERSKFNLVSLPRSKHSRKSGIGPRVTND